MDWRTPSSGICRESMQRRQGREGWEGRERGGGGDGIDQEVALGRVYEIAQWGRGN
jgi:hypothetical protein